MDNIKYIDIDLTNKTNNIKLETIPENINENNNSIENNNLIENDINSIENNNLIEDDINSIEIDNNDNNTGCRYFHIFLGLFISYLVFFIIKNGILNKN